MHVLLLTADLMCSSQLAGAVERAGAVLAVAGGADRLIALAAEHPAALVALDLNAPGADPAALVPRLRALPQPPRAILAFGPHVHEARLAAAQAAGCDQVLSRGAFYPQAEEIVRRHRNGG
jgi:DNA-binding NarL/FixJ family response regulator